MIITINKNLAETMGQLLVRVKKEYEIPEDISVTYCGRLDPAATGECLFLTGEDVYKKDEYLKRDKKYRAEILIGVGTDTGDLLGVRAPFSDKVGEGLGMRKLQGEQQKSSSPLTPLQVPWRGEPLKQQIKNLIGIHQQQPHPFSSFRIEGKPLWEHTRNNNEVEIPTKERTVYDAQLILEKEISYEQVLERVKFLCENVVGDFRQEEILGSWFPSSAKLERGRGEEFNEEIKIQIISIEFHVSSGTFIRGLVETFSKNIEIPCCLYSLERTNV